MPTSNGSNAGPSLPAGADRVEMTTAELAAFLAGIDLNTARRRARYSRPEHPLSKFGENCANNRAHVNVV